jgi:hypothetical protein
VKFYFNDCFPPTEHNRAFVRDVLQQLAQRGPVVSLTTGLQLDDHGGVDALHGGVSQLPPHVAARENLAVQSAVVAGATAFIGTYGGFSYLAPFYGVRSTSFYGNAAGFSPRHLMMVRSALAALGLDGWLDVRGAGEPSPLSGIC